MLLFELEKNDIMVSVPVKNTHFSRNSNEIQVKNTTGEREKVTPKYEDDSVAKLDDTRKTRLSLEQISKLRKLNDLKITEYQQSIKEIRKQFSPPAPQQ